MIFSINLLLPPIIFLNYPIYGLPMLLIAFLKPFLILNASFLLLIANYLPFAFVFSFFRSSFFLSLPFLLLPFHSPLSLPFLLLPFPLSPFLSPLSLSFPLLPLPFHSSFHSSFSLFPLPFPFALFSVSTSPTPLCCLPTSPLLFPSYHPCIHPCVDEPHKHSFIFVSLFGKHEKKKQRTNSMYVCICVCVYMCVCVCVGMCVCMCWYVCVWENSKGNQ